jgi:putative SOS response-associated peptidase YedK
MCGRIALHEPTARLARLFGAGLAEDAEAWQPSYNVAPSTRIPAVVARRPRSSADGAPTGSPAGGAIPAVPPSGGGVSAAVAAPGGAGAAAGPERRLVLLRWGLVPPWAPDPSIGNRMINARAETVATKAAFRTALRRHRAIVPADGFYEWHRGPGRGPSQPWYFTRAEGGPLALAALWEAWRDPQAPPDAAPLRTCTIITAPAGPDVAGVHDRMPVVLEPGSWDRWLDPELDEADAVADLLAVSPAGTLQALRVGRLVSSVGNDGPELIEPAPPEPPDDAKG